MLEHQKAQSEKGDSSMIQNLDTVVRIGAQVKAALERGDTRQFADLMHEHWEIKRARLKDTSGNQDEEINRWYEMGRASGSSGQAGRRRRRRLPALLRRRAREGAGGDGRRESAGVRFAFDPDGSTVVTRD